MLAYHPSAISGHTDSLAHSLLCVRIEQKVSVFILSFHQL